MSKKGDRIEWQETLFSLEKEADVTLSGSIAAVIEPGQSYKSIRDRLGKKLKSYRSWPDKMKFARFFVTLDDRSIEELKRNTFKTSVVSNFGLVRCSLIANSGYTDDVMLDRFREAAKKQGGAGRTEGLAKKSKKKKVADISAMRVPESIKSGVKALLDQDDGIIDNFNPNGARR